MRSGNLNDGKREWHDGPSVYLQIIPAQPGYYAVFADDVALDVIGWAIVQRRWTLDGVEDECRTIEGAVVTSEGAISAESLNGFMRYERRGPQSGQ